MDSRYNMQQACNNSHTTNEKLASPHKPFYNLPSTHNLANSISNSMASISIPSCSLPLLLIYILLPGNVNFTTCQDYDNPTTADAEMAECGPRLLPLATCAPFVQGSSPAPTESCCSNLLNLYDEQPTCLCMLLDVNESTVTPIPLNRTLALQMPALCNLPPNISDCPGLVLIPGSPESHVFNATTANTSSIAVSPTPSTPTGAAKTPKIEADAGVEKSTSTKLKHGTVLYTSIIMVSQSMMLFARLLR